MSHKKPIIGITANYTPKDAVGELTGLGLAGQDWDLLPADYIRAVERAGGCPVIIPVTENPETVIPLLDKLDGMLFSGGSDIAPSYYGELPQEALGTVDPVRDAHEIRLCQSLLRDYDIPLLGICRGNQLINVASGGTLYQDIASTKKAAFRHDLVNYPKWYASRELEIEPGSRLREIFGASRITANGFNHQAVKDLGKNLRTAMKASDGFVEGIEGTQERFVVGIQWHPEMMLDHSDEFLCLFQAFVRACEKRGK